MRLLVRTAVVLRRYCLMPPLLHAAAATVCCVPQRIEEPPQTASLLFSEQGTLRAFTMGYVMDRLQGDTGGLGGAFGLLYAIGCLFPVPEGKPWRPSWQLRLFNTGRSWIQAFLFACDRASSALLPERFLTQHRRGAP